MTDALRILVVDDEDSIRTRCEQVLSRNGYEVTGAAEGELALQLLAGRGFDLVLADVRMPGMNGLELLARIKRASPSVEVIMMTGYATVETAVKAMKAGARDYLTKPFDLDQLLHAVARVAEKKAMEREIAALRSQLLDQPGPLSLVGVSPGIREVVRFIRKVATADCNVLIQGESGTGKEIVARAIHAASPRGRRPFVVADCAALSGSLLGSELFGHVRGAFTGAVTDHKGYFESAEGGTLFLDEVGELPPELQGKLLRAVQEQVVVKLGATQPMKVDVRVVAATHRNLPEMVAAGTFREDLYYRLNVAHVTVPALRERPEDIPLLANYFLKRFAARLGLQALPTLSPEVLGALVEHDWPGNVRELENAVQRAVVMAEGATLSARDFLPGDAAPAAQGRGALRALRRRAARDVTAEHVAEQLRACGGNVTRAAEALGMRRTSLQRLLKTLGLDARPFRKEAPPQ